MKLKYEDLPLTDGSWQPSVSGWRSKLNGRLHNSLEPAIIYNDGEKVWYINEKVHRLDGPAVEYADGSEEWHVDGKQIHEQDFSSAVISFLLGVGRETAKLIEQEMKK